MNCVGHINHGLWRIPDNQKIAYKSLAYWTDLAEKLEEAKFDTLFLADIVGVYDIYKDGYQVSVEEAVQIPANDPLIPIAAMAHVTKNLSFAATVSTSYESPYSFARRMSTLDHLTDGRIAWNIVTSHLASADKNFESKWNLDHDEKYDLADEFLEVCYKLWEESWEENAVTKSRTSFGPYADSSKVHPINHEGKYFKVDGPHLCEPSPQRTPVIYQAGMSDRGRDFAAKNAECIFLGGKNINDINMIINDFKERLHKYNKSLDDVKFFMGLCIITGANEAEVQEKKELYEKYWSLEGNIAHYCGGQNINLSKYSPQDMVYGIPVERILQNLNKIDGKWFKVLIGTPENIVDDIQKILESTDIDGFNLVQYHTPNTFDDFIKYIIPELQARNLYKYEYSNGTYREKLFSQKKRYDFLKDESLVQG